jgi:Asp-tRNA(Asn)/Glu-tRNA(Gln) amidotransferase A subunit family amidase
MPPVPAAKADRTPPPAFADERFHAEDMTGVFNLVAPCPVLSVPCGVHEAAPHTGLPIGMQVVGNRWREDVVLRVGRAVEAALPQLATRRPPI